MQRLFLAFVLVWAVLAGCASNSLRSYGMVSPVESRQCVFEDPEIKVSMSIVEDSRFGLAITNRTEKPVRITWGNSSVIAASGKEEKASYALVGGEAKDVRESSVTTVEPGKTVVAEAWPVTSSYRDKKGRERVYPLYRQDKGKGMPKDLYGREIGIMLTAEVNDHTRLIPLKVKVAKPPFLGLF